VTTATAKLPGPEAAVGPDYAAHPIGGTHHFLLRRLHSLTGILFGGYIIVHLLVNATLAEGTRHDGLPTVFQQQVDQIHRLPFLGVVEWAFIYLPLLYHTVYGIYIVATGQPNVSRYGYGKNWAYLLQRITAMVLVVFIAFHVFSMKTTWFGTAYTFNALEATQSTVNHFNHNPFVTWFLYPLGILAGTFHLANGFWTAAITWGLTVSARAQRRWGAVCVGLFAMTFACGMVALVAAASGEERAIDQSRYIESPATPGAGSVAAPGGH